VAYTLVPPDIARVHEIIRPHVRQTPVLYANGGDLGLGPYPLTFKLEFLQHAGSFKSRGAFTNLLTRSIPPAGVAAASGGNHGVAVAYAAMRRAVRAKIFVPTISSPAKIARIRSYGAEVIVTGDRYADALAADSLAPRRVGALMFPIAQRHIDRVLLVEDSDIVRAQEVLWDVFRIVVEPGGAAAFAALLCRQYEPAPDEHVAVVLCGANIQR
jgi:threonine dehydratase